jgi:putative membrane protein
MMGYGFGFGGGILMLAFWVFVIAGIVWLILTLSRSQGSQSQLGDTKSSALRILEERLARGEIDAEDFKTRRALIDGTSK